MMVHQMLFLCMPPPCGRLSARRSYHTAASHPPPLSSASPGQGKMLVRELHSHALPGCLVVEIAGLLCALEGRLVVAHLQPAQDERNRGSNAEGMLGSRLKLSASQQGPRLAPRLGAAGMLLDSRNGELDSAGRHHQPPRSARESRWHALVHPHYKAKPTGIMLATSQAFLFAQSSSVLEVGRLDLGIAEHLHGICLSRSQAPLPSALATACASRARARMPSLRVPSRLVRWPWLRPASSAA